MHKFIIFFQLKLNLELKPGEVFLPIYDGDRS